MANLRTLLLLLGVISAKDQFVMDEPIVKSEHARVKASGSICELCFFDDTEDQINDSTNKFCLEVQGSQRLGFEWSQSSSAYDKQQESGEVNIDLAFYSKQSLQLDPIIRIDKLFEHSMNMDLSEFSVKWVTAIKYHLYKNNLCLDLYTGTDEYSVIILNNLRFVECYKTLVDCLFDWGQFASSDNTDSEKPLSPFTKLLDKCELGSVQNKKLKEWKPLYNDPTNKQYWVGDGTFDGGCFPGNILIPLIDWDHNVATYGSIFKLASQGPDALANAKPPVVEQRNMGDEPFLGMLWKKSIVYDYVKPIYQEFILYLLEMLGEHVQTYKKDNEEGAYTILDHSAEDYLPVKAIQEEEQEL